MALLNHRTHDGSRHFAEFDQESEQFPWDQVRDHLAGLEGATVTGYLTDNVTEVWIDFDYKKHKFTVHNPMGWWWFFVNDPTCDDEILEAVVVHAAKFLG